MFASSPFDRYAKPYDVSRVLNSDQTLNVDAFNNYSPLYLPGAYAVTYLIAFMLSSCVLVHTGLYYGKTLMNGFKKIRVEKDDIHAKLMRSYPEVPDWWYLFVFALFFSLMIVANEVRCIPSFFTIFLDWSFVCVFNPVVDMCLFCTIGVEHRTPCLGSAVVHCPANTVYASCRIYLRDVRAIGMCLHLRLYDVLYQNAFYRWL